MSESDRQRYRVLLDKACRDEGAHDRATRERIYGRMRELNEDLIRKRGANLGPERATELRRVLREVVDEDRKGFASADPGPVPTAIALPEPPAASPQDTAPLPRRRLGERLATAAAGAAIGVAAVVAGLWTIAPAETSPAPAPGPALPASWQKAFDASMPKVEAAATYLDRVRDAVDDRQMEDGVALTALAGGSFVPLKAVLPELDAKLPKALKGSQVTLRADGVGYKILMDWPLCAAVQIAKPEMVDPVRKRKVLGCTHFGVWNETGAKW